LAAHEIQSETNQSQQRLEEIVQRNLFREIDRILARSTTAGRLQQQIASNSRANFSR
jgi:hypothetical protein